MEQDGSKDLVTFNQMTELTGGDFAGRELESNYWTSLPSLQSHVRLPIAKPEGKPMRKDI